jgi:deoxyribose-phosphate aldolase
MAEAENFDALVNEIAERVQRRLNAREVAVSAPCTASTPEKIVDARALAPPGTPCAPTCAGCGNQGSCGTFQLVKSGALRVSPGTAPKTSSDIAGYIDHTLLKADATLEELRKLCDEACRYNFATVCVNSTHVAAAARLLAGCTPVPIAVVGFPLGAGLTSAKAFEAREAIRAGAKEIDMVINIGALKGLDHQLVCEDIRAVVEASKPYPVKVILETSQLTRDEKVIACALAKAAGAAFVKTSTGFGGGGATAEDVKLMRDVVGPDMGVKASGGVRNQEDALKMIAAGADRIGASASVAIVTGKTGTSKY